MNKTREAQEKIFRDLYNRHKGTPMAVSSESWEHKRIRFRRITDIFGDDDHFSVHDVGMGIADLCAYIRDELPGRSIEYSGTEILAEFCDEAARRYPGGRFHCRDLAEAPGEDRYDYVVMSGVFHQRRDSSIRDWEAFAQALLENAFAMCRKGMAFNMISPFVDFYQTEVYYANLPKFLNFINDRLGRFFTIRHDYALFEFTVHVFKEEYIHSLNPQPELQKYFKI